MLLTNKEISNNLKDYLVGIKEVHTSFYTVKAVSEQEAIQKVYAQTEDVLDIEFSEFDQNLNTDYWTCEEVI